MNRADRKTWLRNLACLIGSPLTLGLRSRMMLNRQALVYSKPFDILQMFTNVKNRGSLLRGSRFFLTFATAIRKVVECAGGSALNER